MSTSKQSKNIMIKLPDKDFTYGKPQKYITSSLLLNLNLNLILILILIILMLVLDLPLQSTKW